MSELVTKSVAQEQQEQKIETRTAVERIAGFTIVATAVAVLCGREGEGLHLPPVPEALNRACPDSKKDVPVRGLIFDVDTGLLREVQPIAQQAAA
jgi:hypothetical protein